MQNRLHVNPLLRERRRTFPLLILPGALLYSVFYILPILMGVTMFFIQKMSPTTVTDPVQQKIMTFMPVIFTVFFLWFPSGLVLYYIVSNLVTIIQQQLIYRGLEKRGLHSREKKKS